MAEFLTTLESSAQIEKIMRTAKTTLILVSPYLQLSRTFHERLQEAVARNVEVTIVYGKNELSPRQQDLLADIPRISLRFLENLHAKCFTSERRMVITSMNLYHYSEKNNREMGVSIDQEKDTALFEDAMVEVNNIVQAAQPKTLTAAALFTPAKKYMRSRVDQTEKSGTPAPRALYPMCQNTNLQPG